jgi:hypothetical protein
MSANTFRSFHRRIARQCAAYVNSLSRAHWLEYLRNQIAAATEQALRGVVGRDRQLLPIPVRTAVGQRRQQRRSHD